MKGFPFPWNFRKICVWRFGQSHDTVSLRFHLHFLLGNVSSFLLCFACCYSLCACALWMLSSSSHSSQGWIRSVSNSRETFSWKFHTCICVIGTSLKYVTVVQVARIIVKKNDSIRLIFSKKFTTSAETESQCFKIETSEKGGVKIARHHTQMVWGNQAGEIGNR